MSGFRQAEAFQDGAKGYFLWAWTNPQPKKRIRSVTVEPADRRFLVAAITLGFLDEEPFNRQAKREVKITLPRKKDAQRPFGLEVQVDRGTRELTLRVKRWTNMNAQR